MKIGIDTHEIGLAVDYIRDTLKKKRIKSQEIIRATMCAEEVISCMISHCPKPEAKISVRVRSFLGNTEIRISCVGTAFDISEIREAETFRMDYADEAANEAFRSLFDRLMKDSLSLRHRQGANYATIAVSRSAYRQLIMTLCALAAGMAAGLIMKAVFPAGFCTAVSANVFSPVSSMFLNALKMIVGPLVLFSIVSSVADFEDIRALGRVVGGVIGGYMRFPLCSPSWSESWFGMCSRSGTRRCRARWTLPPRQASRRRR